MMTRGLLLAVAAAALLALAAGTLWLRDSGETAGEGRAAPPAAASPAVAASGEALFHQKCAVCHGQRAAGSLQGPPLVHRYYEPGHHSDASFLLAVRRGVRAHHWRFGNMPPVPGLSDTDIKAITAYVRALQRANGIF